MRCVVMAVLSVAVLGCSGSVGGTAIGISEEGAAGDTGTTPAAPSTVVVVDAGALHEDDGEDVDGGVAPGADAACVPRACGGARCQNLDDGCGHMLGCWDSSCVPPSPPSTVPPVEGDPPSEVDASAAVDAGASSPDAMAVFDAGHVIVTCGSFICGTDPTICHNGQIFMDGVVYACTPGNTTCGYALQANFTWVKSCCTDDQRLSGNCRGDGTGAPPY